MLMINEKPVALTADDFKDNQKVHSLLSGNVPLLMSNDLILGIKSCLTRGTFDGVIEGKTILNRVKIQFNYAVKERAALSNGQQSLLELSTGNGPQTLFELSTDIGTEHYELGALKYMWSEEYDSNVLFLFIRNACSVVMPKMYSCHQLFPSILCTIHDVLYAFQSKVIASIINDRLATVIDSQSKGITDLSKHVRNSSLFSTTHNDNNTFIQFLSMGFKIGTHIDELTSDNGHISSTKVDAVISKALNLGISLRDKVFTDSMIEEVAAADINDFQHVHLPIAISRSAGGFNYKLVIEPCDGRYVKISFVINKQGRSKSVLYAKLSIRDGANADKVIVEVEQEGLRQLKELYGNLVESAENGNATQRYASLCKRTLSLLGYTEQESIEVMSSAAKGEEVHVSNRRIDATREKLKTLQDSMSDFLILTNITDKV